MPRKRDGLRSSRDLRRALSLLLLAISLAFVGIAWSLSSPIGSSPDDDFHLASAWCSVTAPATGCHRAHARTDPGTRSVEVPAAVGPGASCYHFDASASAACQRTLPADGFAASRTNAGLYPGGFYDVMGIFASSHIVRAVLLMRLTSWVLSLGIIVAAASVARGQLRQAYVFAVIGTSVPLAVFLFASNNPSGLAVAGVGAFWCAALALLRAEGRRAAAAAAAVAIAAATFALISRGDAGLYLAVAAASALLLGRAWERSRRAPGLVVAALAGVGLLGLISADQTSSAAHGLSLADHTTPWTAVLWHNSINITSLWMGSLGAWGLGWLDTAMPDLVKSGMIVTFGGLVVVGIRRFDLIKALAAASTAATIVVIPLYILGVDSTLVGESVQPRYLLPMLVVVLAILLVDSKSGHPVTFRRSQRVLIVATVSVAHALALHTNIRRYVTGQDVLGMDLGRRVEWWWGGGFPGPNETWVLGSLAFAAAISIAVVLSTWRAGTPPPSAAGGDPRP